MCKQDRQRREISKSDNLVGVKLSSGCCKIVKRWWLAWVPKSRVSGQQPHKDGFGSIFGIDLFLKQKNTET